MADAAPDAKKAKKDGDTQPPALSPAAQQRARMEALIHAVEDKSRELTALLRQSGFTFERFVEVFRRALIANPDIVKADAGSVIKACMDACTDGLLPDGKQGAIVVYNMNVEKRKNQPPRYVLWAQWQPMYQGLLLVAYRSGNFQSIEARTVYAGDEWDYALGDEPFIKHKPRARPKGQTQPEIVAAYAVARTVNGGVFREVMEGADLGKVQAVAKSQKGPGKDWPEEMARKAPLRRMWKFLPKNEAMERIAEHDDENFDTDQLPAAEEVRPRAFTPGFAPKALAEGADPKMDVPAPEIPAEEPEGDLTHGEDASNEEAKSYVASDHEEEPDATQPLPAVEAFNEAIEKAAHWLAIKQALKTFTKPLVAQDDRYDRTARMKAWTRYTELPEEERAKTEFTQDPLMFECWLLAEGEPEERVRAGWEAVQKLATFKKLDEAEQRRIGTRVFEVLGIEDGEP